MSAVPLMSAATPAGAAARDFDRDRRFDRGVLLGPGLGQVDHRVRADVLDHRPPVRVRLIPFACPIAPARDQPRQGN